MAHIISASLVEPAHDDRASGAPHFPDDTPYRKKFSGKYGYRLITAGVGHHLPQGAPQAFAQAVVDADRF